MERRGKKKKEKEKKTLLFPPCSPVRPSECGPRTDRKRRGVHKSAPTRSLFFETLFTYCIEVSLFHDNALTPKCAVDLFRHNGAECWSRTVGRLCPIY